MFSDIYKIREVADGLCLEVEGKVSRPGRGRGRGRGCGAGGRRGRAGSGFRRSPARGCAILPVASWRRRLSFRARVFLENWRRS